MFSGEKPMPVGNSVVTTEKRNSIQKDNDLLDIVRYLETQYKGLGIKTLRQEFLWRGIKQVNLIAKVKGSLPPSQNKPVLIADHYDTAFEEDTFEKTKVRQASRGANDNYVATSGLLTAARYFQGAKPKHDIWFVHLTGEEFPGDDLGARIFVRDLLKDKQDVSAVLLMDMIGYNPKNRKDFQINSGLSRESMRVALLASELVSKANLNLKPLVLHRYEPKSYLYNTDGIIFDEAGFPIVFFNEVMNRYVYDRKGYHDTHDRVSLVNFDYAFEIVKLVTLTADALAHR
jgi:Zn-dependent M28 family amino/carboxypeptidase